MTVNLATPTVGSVDVTYLTGEGRALNDLYLEITRQTLGTAADDIGLAGVAAYRLSLSATSYSTVQLPRINVPFALTTSGRGDSRLFSNFLFDPNRLVVQTSTNPAAYAAGPNLNNVPFNADARIRVFPGRTSTIQVNVAPSIFPTDTNGTDRTFDSTQFRGLNYSTDTTDPDIQSGPKLASRLSDFVRFNLAGMATDQRPNLRYGYGAGDVTPNGASYVYFSGDNIALSNNISGTVAGTSVFQEVATQFSDDPTDPVGNTLIGLWSNASSGGFSGTYDLRDILPSTIETDVPINRLVSLYGQFRDFDEVLSGGSSFEIVMFPNSSESYFTTSSGGATTGRQGDIVALVRSGGLITNMYFGGVDLKAGTFSLFPIRYLGSNPATFTDEVDGTVSGYVDSSGVGTTDYARVRKFKFSIGTGASLPSGFTSTGTVTVFRV